MAVLISFALLSIGFSFLCSILEAVLLSVTPTFLNTELKKGRKYAKKLQALKSDVDEPLIAILTLNTVAHTVGAIGVGAAAEGVWDDSVTFFGIPAIGMISAVMTLLILIASEIIPKTIGATYWRKLAKFTTFSTNVLVNILKYTGILFLLRLFTRMVGSSSHKSVLSRQDMSVMAEMGEKEGVFKKNESTIIQNLMRFEEIKARDIMTPRTVVKASEENTSIRDFYDVNQKLRFSRIPLFAENIDHTSGYVLKDDLLTAIIKEKGDQALKSIMRQIHVVPENIAIPKLFDELLNMREHIALVTDEYGGMQGIVTMEDILETLLGLEIVDEYDSIEDLQLLARKKWEERARNIGILEDESNT